MKVSEIKSWCADHKKELIMLGMGCVVATVGGVVIYKNRDSIAGVWRGTEHNLLTDTKSENVIESIAETSVPILEKTVEKIPVESLTGNQFTARDLGSKVLCSAQDINRRIVENGFAEKLPCGEYRMTEAGKIFGKDTLKVTRSGHTFSNIEWDEAILKHLFSPEELTEIERKHDLINQLAS